MKNAKLDQERERGRGRQIGRLRKPSDGYLKIVEWSSEDGCYVGTCPDLMLGGIHGPNKAKVYRELCQAVEEWICIHEEDGKGADRFVLLAAHRLLKRTNW